MKKTEKEKLDELFKKFDENLKDIKNLSEQRDTMINKKDYLGIIEIQCILEDTINSGIALINDISRISRETGLIDSVMDDTLEPYLSWTDIIVRREQRLYERL